MNKAVFWKNCKKCWKKQRFPDHSNCNKRNLFSGRSKRFSEYLLVIEMKKVIMDFMTLLFSLSFYHVFYICFYHLR